MLCWKMVLLAFLHGVFLCRRATNYRQSLQHYEKAEFHTLKYICWSKKENRACYSYKQRDNLRNEGKHMASIFIWSCLWIFYSPDWLRTFLMIRNMSPVIAPSIKSLAPLISCCNVSTNLWTTLSSSLGITASDLATETIVANIPSTSRRISAKPKNPFHLHVSCATLILTVQEYPFGIFGLKRIYNYETTG